MKKIGLATAVLFAMTGAHAYQVEVKGQSEFVNTTQSPKNFTGDLQGTYYFKDVDASKGPLAEAAFLNKASNVSLAYHYDKYTTPNFNYQNNTGGVKGEAYFTTPYTGSVPLYTSASYSHTNLDGKDGAEDLRGDRYAVELGAEPTQNFLMAVGYTNNHNALDAFDIADNGIASAVVKNNASAEKHKDFATARAKYVGAIDNTNMAIGFELKGIFNNDAGAYGLKTDLYLNPALSVGMAYTDTSDMNSYYDHVWGGNVNYFITPAVSVGATYTKANAKTDELPGIETVGLNAKVRF
ncbi:porin Omp33-36 [Acinetobacter sp. MD2(2019)]|uniref:porin Omp33-36 n=1 Tax=Acinetobacter sp. MD2(2019) TaxID=2605273 RepID=UPI002D1F5D4E|nr:porin Omp33-36 [Acinetobacter sp. MD2(2019)]MEB3754595.1 porin Omp33-36 [Acinetobacter sp. MD2(2019)]